MPSVERRIPRFHDKLRAALEGAGLPSGVEPWVDPPSCGKDPRVCISLEYAPRYFAKGFAQTDARERSHLDPRWVAERCAEYAERASRDPRYTEASRVADGALAAILRGWLSAPNDSSGPEEA